MESILGKELMQKNIKISIENSKRALAVYEQNTTVSEATRALLELNAITQAGYLKIIEGLMQVVENLETSNRKLNHAFNVEKQKNTDGFKNN